MDIVNKVHANVRKEVPDFIFNSVLYCDNLTLTSNRRSSILITKDLKFFEFQKKQLLHSIDLRESCLGKELDRLKLYNGPKGKWFDDDFGQMDQSVFNQSADSSRAVEGDCKIDNGDVYFGKYIYRNQDIKRVYLLIKCWDKLVVLERNENKLSIAEEFESVLGFKLVHGKPKYKVVVEIHFLDDSKVQRDFNEKNSLGDEEMGQPKTSSELKQILERVRNVKTELQLHKGVTQKEFSRLENIQAFGCHYLRSSKLEEKEMLACGDVWLRITPYDIMVLGVPLINNCGSGNCKVLKNLKPLVSQSDSFQNTFSYEYKIFKLNQCFEDLESLETFFQADDRDLQEDTWVEDKTQYLMPQSFSILLITMPFSQLFLSKQCKVSLYFEIEKKDKSNTIEIFQQQIFLKNLDINEIIRNRKSYEISYNVKNLHQDFLASIGSCLDLSLSIEFNSSSDLNMFENLLTSKCDFHVISRSNQANESKAMDLDIGDSKQELFPHLLYYNKKPNSIWFGMVLLRKLIWDSEADSEKTFWSFYSPTKEKLFAFLKALFDDLLLIDCNIKHIECPGSKGCKESQLLVIELENNLRQELKTFMEYFNNRTSHTFDGDNVDEIANLQLKTDLIVNSLEN